MSVSKVSSLERRNVAKVSSLERREVAKVSSLERRDAPFAMGRSWWKFWQRKKPKKDQPPEINIWSGIETSPPPDSVTSSDDVIAGLTSPEVTQPIVKEPVFNCQVRAIRDYHNTSDLLALTFRQGDVIKVLEQSPTGRWRGVIIQSSSYSTSPRAGYFPSSAVVLLERPGQS
ncbi:uncharacterized protein LOC122374539 [Amphibalanus amphitrite]|uniref:uncharacterized protein LOC122374539 n=1 Tax=Amphibalanus amphitrite TaxID=1232801 RepID=UPI001C921C32|nr:uncharacterized protein LOC122374539 [Amphibalanus amphitrite]